MGSLVLLVVVVLLFDTSHKCLSFSPSFSSPFQRIRRVAQLRMDDEQERTTAKTDITALPDGYLSDGFGSKRRFTKLSSSGHDLTPLTQEEIKHELEKSADDAAASSGSSSNGSLEVAAKPYLGGGKKGLYCAKIGGLPLASTGYLEESLCNPKVIAFSEVCDLEHILIQDAERKRPDGLPFQQILDVRCREVVGYREETLITGQTNEKYENVYYFFSEKLEFYPVDKKGGLKLPIKCQPANFWGTEGQFVAWRQNMIARPLSY